MIIDTKINTISIIAPINFQFIKLILSKGFIIILLTIKIGIIDIQKLTIIYI